MPQTNASSLPRIQRPTTGSIPTLALRNTTSSTVSTLTYDEILQCIRHSTVVLKYNCSESEYICTRYTRDNSNGSATVTLPPV